MAVWFLTWLLVSTDTNSNSKLSLLKINLSFLVATKSSPLFAKVHADPLTLTPSLWLSVRLASKSPTKISFFLRFFDQFAHLVELACL